MILAIDPGTSKTGYVIFDGERVHESGVLDNEVMLDMIRVLPKKIDWVACEMIASYGMSVGAEVFETCVWIGRFMQACKVRFTRVFRKEVKLHLCGSLKAKDANIRQALLDMFPRTGGGAIPQVGTKKERGPLYGVSTHAWAALGVAVTAMGVTDVPQR